MSGEGTGQYCHAAGNWGVSNGRFVAEAADCTGTILSFDAPASSTAMDGTVNASSGRTATFSVTKQ